MTPTVFALQQQALAWHTLYDASTRSFRGWEIAAAGLVIAGAALFVRRESADDAPLRRGVRLSLVLFGAAWTLVIGGGQWSEHARLRRALRDRQFTRIDGTVYDRPRGAEGEGNWLIDTPNGAHWYPYRRSPLATGYVRRAPGGAGIRTGDRVRITDVNGHIARIELAYIITR